MSVYLHASRNGSKIAGRRGVGRLTARKVVEGFKNEELDFCPLLIFSATPRTITRPTFGRLGFRSVPVLAREDECLDYF